LLGIFTPRGFRLVSLSFSDIFREHARGNAEGGCSSSEEAASSVLLDEIKRRVRTE
jgi:hypothetical protein